MSCQDERPLGRLRDVVLLTAVLAVALVVRAGVLVTMPSGLDIDTDSYRLIAVTLRLTGVYGVPAADRSTAQPFEPVRVRPTAYRPPLYPLLLSVLTRKGNLSPVAVAVLHLGLGLGTVALVYLVGRQWGLRGWSAVAALLTACDPILLYQSAQLMTETLAAFLAIGCLACLTRVTASNVASDTSHASQSRQASWWALASGVMIGLASLCRPTFLPWGALILISFCASHQVRRWQTVASLVCGIAVTILPWGWRNYSQLGQFKLTTTHGGYTLLLGNNPSFYRFLKEGEWGSVWKSDALDRAWLKRRYLTADETRLPPPDGRASRTEFEDDQLAYSYARQAIQDDPAAFGLSCLVRFGRFWNVLPHRLQEDESTTRFLMRLSTAGWYVVLYTFAMVALIACHKAIFRPPWWSGWLLVLTFMLIHSLFWSDLRMRAPAMPFICLVAAMGVARVGQRLWAKSTADRGA